MALYLAVTDSAENRIIRRGKFFDEKLAEACICSMITVGVG
jgi:hypothetical protein